MLDTVHPCFLAKPCPSVPDAALQPAQQVSIARILKVPPKLSHMFTLRQCEATSFLLQRLLLIIMMQLL